MERISNATSVAYASIPGFPYSRVEGHANELILGVLGGRPVVTMRGRIHMYEGWSAAEVAFPVRVMQALGTTVLIISNAAGGLNADFVAGNLMLIRDHVFLPGLAGHNPLQGPNQDDLGPRFPSMVDAYDSDLRALARQVAGGDVREGVYAMVAGPSYETPAEYQALRGMGADAVGMSTCPEVVVARHMGLRVLGISLVTNVLNGKPATHEEVLAVAAAAAGRFCEVVEGVVRLVDE